MKLRLFQVDAFAAKVFEGNPAAVCPLEAWLDDSMLQAIASENNLSETAFFVRDGDAFELRWFTPVAEVDLCGHATLASAHVLYRHLGHAGDSIRFKTRSGELKVTRHEHGLRMNLPAVLSHEAPIPAGLVEGLGKTPQELVAGTDYIARYASEADIRALAPDFVSLRQVGLRGVIASAPGDSVDFVSRCFFPRLGINEDPVTGSAHCQLAPYWSQRLGREQLHARQLSSRGGSLTCRVHDDRVLLTGTVADYMCAQLDIPDAAVRSVPTA